MAATTSPRLRRVPTYRNPRLAARFTSLFALLAIVIAALAWLAWRSSDEARRFQAARATGDELVAMVHELEATTQPVASRAMCAATGGPALAPEDTEAPTWPVVSSRLTSMMLDKPEMLEAMASLRRELLLFEQSFVDPLRRACAQQQRLGAAEVQSRIRVAAPQRARVQDGIKRLRNLALDHRLKAQRAGDEATQVGRRWLGLLSLASLVLGVSAVVVVRSFSLRLNDLGRKLFDESQEREIVVEQLSVAQRRMRVVVDHVRDAVVSFDAYGRVQWVNPAAEDLFGVERQVIRGCPITQLLPGLDEKTRVAASPEHSAATLIDEHGLPWSSRSLLLVGQRVLLPSRTESQPMMLDASLIQTRVDGHDVGVCVLRASDRPLPTPPPPKPALAATAPEEKLDLREGARRAVEACATPAHVRDARIELALDEAPLWIGADAQAVQGILSTVLLKALDALPQGGVIGLTVMRVGQAARAVVSDGGRGLVELAALELSSVETLDADTDRHAYGGSLAQARVAAKATGGSLGFRPGSATADEAVWVQWPLIEDRSAGWGG